MLNFYWRGNSIKVFGKDLRLLGELSNLRLSSGEHGFTCVIPLQVAISFIRRSRLAGIAVRSR
jgi:hypothetical protein